MDEYRANRQALNALLDIVDVTNKFGLQFDTTKTTGDDKGARVSETKKHLPSHWKATITNEDVIVHYEFRPGEGEQRGWQERNRIPVEKKADKKEK